MKNSIMIFFLIASSLICRSQNGIPYNNIKDIEKLSSESFDKRFLKACTLTSKIKYHDSIQNDFKKNNRTIDKKKDNYIEMRSNPSRGYFQFDERISNSEEVNYLFNDSVLSSISIRKDFYFKYKDLDIPLSIYSFYHYHKNGNLMFSGCSLVANIAQNIRINMSRIYNEKGKLTKKINYNKKFNLKFSDVIKIGYDNFKIEEKEEMYLSRAFNEKESYWIIELQLPDDNFVNKYLIINDKSREILTKYNETEVEKFRFIEYQEKLGNLNEILK